MLPWFADASTVMLGFCASHAGWKSTAMQIADKTAYFDILSYLLDQDLAVLRAKLHWFCGITSSGVSY
jgi:hypothetical protein